MILRWFSIFAVGCSLEVVSPVANPFYQPDAPICAEGGDTPWHRATCEPALCVSSSGEVQWDWLARDGRCVYAPAED